MNYQESLTYLIRCTALGSKPGLDAVTELLNRLGNPQNALRSIHLAGTNGKGSVGCLLQFALKASGYKVGFFTSPYLLNPREMIRLNGMQISETAFASVLTQVGREADAMEKSGLSHPTEFEIMTAAAFLLFAGESCDFVIIEAGMGGAKDATNVMRMPEATVLTRIDYDHLQFLGSTLSEITREKCGIFRPGCPVVVYPKQEKESLLAIEQEADQCDAPLVLPLKDAVLVSKIDEFGSVFSYGKWKDIHISLCGEHQIYNAVTALATLSVLQNKGFPVEDRAIYEGFSEAVWEGRFEILSKNPLVLLDGAHNLNGAIAFSNTVSTCFPHTKFIGVVGMLADKDFEASLSAFSKVCHRLIVTEVPNPRSATVDVLMQTAQRMGIEVVGERNPEEAVRRAFTEKRADEGVLCVGSLYALSTFKKQCQHCLE